jgi:hypothetical protein
VCKDFKRCALHLSKKEQEKWEEYVSKHNLDVKKDVQRDRPRMTINWLKPFLALTQDDYKFLAKKCIVVVNGTWRKPMMFFNAVTSKVSLHFAEAIDI